MQPILARLTASISELKRSPTELLKQAGNEPIAILNHNTPTAYLVSAAFYEAVMEMADDVALRGEVDAAIERIKSGEEELVEVDLNEYL